MSIAILKINQWKDTPPVLFIFHNKNNYEVKAVGPHKKIYYEDLINKNKLAETPQEKIIEQYYKNIELMDEVINCKFYEIKLETKITK